MDERLPQKHLGVSIVNFSTGALIRPLLDSLRAFAGTRELKISVVIADNSDDLQASELSATSDVLNCISILSDQGNVGYGRGNNLACSALLDMGVEVLWILNPDILILRGDAIAFYDQINQGAGLWGTYTIQNGVEESGLSLIQNWTSKSAPVLVAQHVRLSKSSTVYVSGHSLALSRSSWLKLRGFDPQFFLYMEEVDLAKRAQQLSMTVTATDKVQVQHSGGVATGSNRTPADRSELSLAFSSRSRILFFRKHYSHRVGVIVVIRVLYAAYLATRGNLGGAKATLFAIVSDPTSRLESQTSPN